MTVPLPPLPTEKSLQQSPGMSPATQPKIALPEELVHISESQWLFTSRELSLTPSTHDGLPMEKERANRAKGVNFILQVGVMLRLPQTTLATASVFLHRFYMRHSMVEGPGKVGYHYYPMAATSLFLATKVEETCRKMKELVIACVRVAQKDPQKAVDDQDREYWRWRDNILLNEDLLLEALCFDLTLESPYTALFRLLVHFREDQNKRLRNAAWAFVNDSCLTMLCLMASSKAIAASALFASARLCGVTFADDPSTSVHQPQPWWQTIGVPSADIVTACNYMCDVYENLPPRSSRETGLYDRVDGSAGMDTTRHQPHQQQQGNQNGETQTPLPKQEQSNPPSKSTNGVTASHEGHPHPPSDAVIDRHDTRSPLKRRRENSTAEVAAVSIPEHTVNGISQASKANDSSATRAGADAKINGSSSAGHHPPEKRPRHDNENADEDNDKDDNNSNTIKKNNTSTTQATAVPSHIPPLSASAAAAAAEEPGDIGSEEGEVSEG